MRIHGLIAVVAAGCVGGEAPADSNGNATLGIARFEIEDTADRTSIVGLDAERHEVARLDLIHGKFEVTGVFKDDYPDEPEVIGRKLDITLHGEKKLVWETAGFEPTLEMPAPPSKLAALAAFLDDPHVKPVLARWQIGFERDQGEELAYASGAYSIVNPYNCSGQQNCGSFIRGGQTMTAGTCGGGAAALQAWRGTSETTPVHWRIAQCCPAGSGNMSTRWYGTKTCPLSGTTSPCGTASTACKGCPGYPDAASYECLVTNPGGSLIAYQYSDTPY